MSDNRIHTEARLRQPVAFTGMEYGLCSPTDSDGSMDLGDDCRVIVELKHRGVPYPEGQCRHQTGWIDIVNEKRSRAGILILAHHDVRDPRKTIVMAKCKVDAIYTRQGWKHRMGWKTVQEVLDEFVEKRFGPGSKYARRT